jgi:hypothetical protein
MIVRLDLPGGHAATAVLADGADLSRFHVEVRHPGDGPPLRSAVDACLRAADAGWVEGDVAFVTVAALRRLAVDAGVASPEWDAGFAKMLAYAASKGWLSDDGTAVQAHIES